MKRTKRRKTELLREKRSRKESAEGSSPEEGRESVMRTLGSICETGRPVAGREIVRELWIVRVVKQ